MPFLWSCYFFQRVNSCSIPFTKMLFVPLNDNIFVVASMLLLFFAFFVNKYSLYAQSSHLKPLTVYKFPLDVCILWSHAVRWIVRKIKLLAKFDLLIHIVYMSPYSATISNKNDQKLYEKRNSTNCRIQIAIKMLCSNSLQWNMCVLASNQQRYWLKITIDTTNKSI